MKRAGDRSVSSWASCVALALSAKVSFAQSPVRPAAPAPVTPTQPAPAPAAPAQPAHPPAPVPHAAPAQPAQPAPVTPAAPAAPVAPAPAPAAPTAPAPAASPEAAPPAAPAPVAPAPAPANEPVVVAAPPAVVAPPPLDSAPPAPPAAVPEAAAWYQGITFSAFADAYGAVDFNFPKAPQQARQNPVRAFDNHTGFALNWVGIDVQKQAEPVGGMISLRFGPGAQRLASACVDADTCDNESSIGLANVKQAFVSWKPASILTLDLGKFDTPYGAEVADSQFNINYTRGVLYWLGQPAYHTGLRVNIDPARSVNLKLLAVNGWNRTIDNNSGKTFGLQGTYRLPKAPDSAEDLLTVALGYMVGPEHGDSFTVTCGPDQRFDPILSPGTGCVASQGSPGGSGVVDGGSANTKGLRHFLDLVAVATPTPALKLLLNTSLGIDNNRDAVRITEFHSTKWFGVMVGGRYALNEHLGLAGRIEHYSDPDAVTTGFTGNKVTLRTATVTLDYAPAAHMVLFLDGRIDWSNKPIFPVAVHDDGANTAASLTLGAVVSTN